MPYGFGLMALLIPALIGAFLSYDRVIRIEYHEHHEQWMADGQPKGFIWKPPDWWKTRPTVKGLMISQGLWLIWLFTTPAWAKEDSKAVKFLWQYRILVLIWNVGMLIIWSVMGIIGS